MKNKIVLLAAASAFSLISASAHAALPALLSLPLGLIHSAYTGISKTKTSSDDQIVAVSDPQSDSANHWVMLSNPPRDLANVQALEGVQKEFSAAIREKIPGASITLDSLTIPAGEATASSSLLKTGWLECANPVFEARAQQTAPDVEREAVKRLHVCITYSQHGYQTAIYAFDPARHSFFGGLVRRNENEGFFADPERNAVELEAQLRSILGKHLPNTVVTYTGISYLVSHRSNAVTDFNPKD